jgi:hypothetical protein
MAAAIRKPANSSGFGRIIENVAQRLDTALNGRLTSALKSSTSLTPARGIFDSNPRFGVVAAMESTVTRDWTKAASDFARFTIDEARERLAALVDGDFFVDSFQDLMEYLKERSLALETRIFNGNIINFLVDAKTKQSVPAAQVHPSLSHQNMRALEMRGSLKRVVGSSDPAQAFGNWQGMSMLLEQSSENLGYTVSGDTGYFGKKYAVATANADENMAIIRRARSEGVELIVPNRLGHEPGDMVAGMPILRKSKSMDASLVHSSLDQRNLTLAFGQTMFDLYEELGRKNSSGPAATRAIDTKTAEVLSFEDFKARYTAPKNVVNEFADSDDDGLGFGGLVEPVKKTSGKRSIALRRGADSAGSLAVWDADNEFELQMAPNCLPEGEYQRLAVNGELEGYSIVGQRGSLKHLDQNRRPVQEIRREQEFQQEFGTDEDFAPALQRRLK